MRNHSFKGPYFVTDTDLSLPLSVPEVVKAAVENGIGLVQYREKNKSTRFMIDMARRLKKILRPKNIPLIINDRVDVALAMDADGVHLGQSDMPALIARELLGPDKIIGLTVESLEQAKEGMDMDVDYLGISSLFPTFTKLDVLHYWNEDQVKQIVATSTLPLVPIGGIHQGNISQVLARGFKSAAFVSAICNAKTVEEVKLRARELSLAFPS